jgi:hypothetical protein
MLVAIARVTIRETGRKDLGLVAVRVKRLEQNRNMAQNTKL